MAKRELQVGDALGGFQIEKELGRGGMGVVYKAHELSLNRKVALKVLAQRLTFDEEFVERFRREAQMVAQLSHPNVVGILAYGEQDEVYYYAMEFVEGTDLHEVLAESGGISAQRALTIAKEVTSALDEAHRLGIVHRDLKPQNIMIDRKGRAKVTDFGLARFAQSDSRLTQTGTFLGTPEYASPEQAAARALDTRSDIYSLGAVLYRTFSGRVPVTADTPMAVVSKIISEPVTPIRKANAQVPDPVARVIDKMMAFRPDDRYQTPVELLAALEDCEQALRADLSPTVGPGMTVASAAPETLLTPAPEPSAGRAATVASMSGLPPRVASSRPAVVLGVVAVAVVGLLGVAGLGALWLLRGAADEASPSPETEVASAEASGGSAPESPSLPAVEPEPTDSLEPVVDAAPAPTESASVEADSVGTTSAPGAPASVASAPIAAAGRPAASIAPAGSAPKTAPAPPPPPAALPEVPTVYAAVSGEPQLVMVARTIVETAITRAGLNLTPMEGRSHVTLLVEVQPTGRRDLTFAGQYQEQVIVTYSLQAVDPASGRTVVGPSTGEFEYAGTRMKLRASEALEPAAAELVAKLAGYWQSRRSP